jgi:hypothetical protein
MRRSGGRARPNGALAMLTFVKQELFLLGLASLLLAAAEGSLARICVPQPAASFGLHWRPGDAPALEDAADHDPSRFEVRGRPGVCEPKPGCRT